jgi:hypothetical protein
VAGEIFVEGRMRVSLGFEPLLDVQHALGEQRG